MEETYTTLQEITGQESGAVLYIDGEIWIGNWSSIAGIPRTFAGAIIGLGEDLTAVPCDVPTSVILAMLTHEGIEAKLEDVDVYEHKFAAWKVNAWRVKDDYIVVTNIDWN